MFERSIFTLFQVPGLLLGTLCIIANSVLIHVLRKLQKLGTISFKLVLVLSISDILVGINTLMVFTLHEVVDKEMQEAAGLCTNIALYFCGCFSFCMVSIIAFDRYTHMKYLTNYVTIMTNRRAIIMVGTALLMSGCFDAGMICARIFGFVLPAQLTLNICSVLLITTLFILYFKTYRAIATRTRQMNLNNHAPAVAPRRRNPGKEFSRSVLFIFATLVLCCTPYLVCSVYRLLDSSSKFDVFLELLIDCVFCTNSLLNAVIFLIFNRDLRRHVLQFFKCL